MVVLLHRLAATTHHCRLLRSHPSNRVQLKIQCRLPTLGTAASHHQTLQHAFTPGQLDLDTMHHLDRRLLAPTPPGNKWELAQHLHLLLKPLWTLSFYAYVSR